MVGTLKDCDFCFSSCLVDCIDKSDGGIRENDGIGKTDKGSNRKSFQRSHICIGYFDVFGKERNS